MSIFGELTFSGNRLTRFFSLWEKLQLKVKYVDAEDAATMTAMAATDITAPTQITAPTDSKLTYADYTAGKSESI